MHVRLTLGSAWLTVLMALTAGLRAQGLAGPTAVTHSPYYQAYQPAKVPPASARIGVLPVQLQHPSAARILSQTRAAELLDSLTRYLGRQPNLQPVAMPAGAKPGHLPAVYFGSPDQVSPGTVPGFALNLRNPNPGQGVVHLAGWNGQGKTRQALIDLMASQQLNYLLVPLLREAAIYYSMKLGKVGPISAGQVTGNDYYLDEGSNHVRHFKRLENLNSRADLLVLAGALIDAQGRLVLIGAEGLADNGTGFQPNRLANNEDYTFGKADYEALLRPQRRDDLPGTPVAWQEAAQQLVQRLTGRRPYRESSPYQFLLVPQEPTSR